MAELIAIACALCAGAAAASAAPTPAPPPAGAAAVSVPASPDAAPAAQVQQDMRADSPVEPVAETPSDTRATDSGATDSGATDSGATDSGATGDVQPSAPAAFGETSSAPTFQTEAIIGTAAKPAPAPAAPGLHRIPQRFGGLPDAGSAPDAPPRPRLSVGAPIAVTTMHVVRDKGASSAMRGADCAVQLLHAKPAGTAREVGTLSVDGAPAQHEDILSLVRQRACQAGANAVLIKRMDKKQVAGVSVDHVEAVALVLGTPPPPVDPSPVPRTITVTPDGPAAPKTITVDPGPSR